MMSLLSVHFDNNIPNWRKSQEVLNHNVLALVVEGKVKYYINDISMIAEKGELLFIPISTLRSSENFEGEHQKITILFTHDDDDAQQLSLLSKATFNTCRSRNFEYIKRRFEQLYLEVTGEAIFSPFIIAGIFQEIVGLVAREFELVEVTPIKLKLANQLQKYLVSNYRETIQIEQLATLIDRSANYTISLFREMKGLSPIQYVHMLRMKEACNLLANTDLTVTEISDYLGYYDHSYFFRIFKKYMSLSPTEYRQSVLHTQTMHIF